MIKSLVGKKIKCKSFFQYHILTILKLTAFVELFLIPMFSNIETSVECVISFTNIGENVIISDIG